MREGTGIGASCRLKVGMRRELHAFFRGDLQCITPGIYEKPFRNTLGDNWYWLTAKGAADGVFDAIDSTSITDGVTTWYPTTVLYAGGDGNNLYATWKLTWTNNTAASVTITAASLGHDLDGTPIVYAAASGLSYTIPVGVTVEWTWTITMIPGADLDQKYAYRLMQMAATGSFPVPNYIGFYEDNYGSYSYKTATLNDGGTGAEDYHEWTAEYVCSEGSITITDIALAQYTTEYVLYTEHDIVDKSLAITEVLTATIRIVHEAAV